MSWNHELDIYLRDTRTAPRGEGADSLERRSVRGHRFSTKKSVVAVREIFRIELVPRSMYPSHTHCGALQRSPRWHPLPLALA